MEEIYVGNMFLEGETPTNEDMGFMFAMQAIKMAMKAGDYETLENYKNDLIIEMGMLFQEIDKLGNGIFQKKEELVQRKENINVYNILLNRIKMNMEYLNVLYNHTLFSQVDDLELDEVYMVMRLLKLMYNGHINAYEKTIRRESFEDNSEILVQSIDAKVRELINHEK